MGRRKRIERYSTNQNDSGQINHDTEEMNGKQKVFKASCFFFYLE
jgi:hypothetical protein